MPGTRLRISTRLLLLVAILCTCRISSVVADATPRILRSSAHDENFNFAEGNSIALKAAHIPDPKAGAEPAETPSTEEYPAKPPSSHTTKAESKHETPPASHTIKTEGSAGEQHKTAHEGPTMMMLVGPAVAGVLAIVLIGAVIAFKNRTTKQ